MPGIAEIGCRFVYLMTLNSPLMCSHLLNSFDTLRQEKLLQLKEQSDKFLKFILNFWALRH